MAIRVDGIFYVLDAISDFVLQGLLAECRDRFYICSMHKHRTTEIENLQLQIGSQIQAIKQEIQRREERKVKVAA